MDGLSIATAVATLAEVAAKIYDHVKDAIKEPTQRAQVLEAVDGLADLLKILESREKDARDKLDDVWYQGLRDLARSASSPASAAGRLVPDPTRKGDGALVRLRKAMTMLDSDLAISQEPFKRFQQRFVKWSHDKKKSREVIEQIEKLHKQVDSILNQDHFALSLSIKDVVVKSDDRLKALEDRGERQEKEAAYQKQNAEREKIIEWLSPLEFRKQQSQIFNASVHVGIGQDLFDSEEFEAWVAGRPWILYGYGKPGAGKTVLSSIIVERLRKRFEKEEFPVFCLYLDYKSWSTQTIENLLGSLLKQSIQHQEDNLRLGKGKVEKLFWDSKNEARPFLDDLFSALEAELKSFRRAFLVVDAFDEVSPNIEAELLDRLRILQSSGLSIMVTCRPIDEAAEIFGQVYCNHCERKPLKLYLNCSDCEDGFFDLCFECKKNGVHCNDQSHVMREPYQEVTLNIAPSDREIRLYVEEVLRREKALGARNMSDSRLHLSRRGTTKLGNNCREDPALESRIIDAVVPRADGLFMLARLYMDALKTKRSVEEVDDALQTLPVGYTETYERTMERISSTNEANPEDDRLSIAKKILCLVVRSYRSLSLQELQEALSVNLRNPDYRAKARYERRTLYEITAGLVTVDADEKAVRLAHLTVQEYFSGTDGAKWFEGAAAYMAQITLQYLSREELAEPCQGIREDLEFEARRRSHPFSAYAYQHWGDHARDAIQDNDIQDITRNFVSDPLKISACTQAAWYLDSDGTTDWDVRKGANNLHVCAWFGLNPIVTYLLDRGVDINSQDPTLEQTALMYACRQGHVETVAVLLDHGASMDLRSARGSTALFEAVIENREEVVQHILARPNLLVGDSPALATDCGKLLEKKLTGCSGKGLNPNEAHPGRRHRTALMFAAQYDNKAQIVEALLLRKDVDVNKKDFDSNTALILATISGCSTVVSLLLDHESLDINAVNRTGSSALIAAANCNRIDIASQLLAKGVESSIHDFEGGGTALFGAVEREDIEMVETLLNHGASVQDCDDLGRSLLHQAASSGNIGILDLLLCEGLDQNAQDNDKRAPLHEASRNGKLDVVKTLLRGGANPLLKDRFGRKPQTVAWQNGHVDIMRALEGKEDRLPNEPSVPSQYPDAERLPLWSLAKLGIEAFVSDQIGESSNDLPSSDPDSGDTALHCAVFSSHLGILGVLLESGNIPANSVNHYARTALHLAAVLGNLAAVKMLIAHSSPLEAEDQWGATALFIAQAGNHLEVALELIEAGAVVDKQKLSIQPLFFAAVEFGRKTAVQILINEGASHWAKNLYGKTPLQVAKDADYGEIVQVLTQNKSFKVPSLQTLELESELDGLDESRPVPAPFSRLNPSDSSGEQTIHMLEG